MRRFRTLGNCWFISIVCLLVTACVATPLPTPIARQASGSPALSRPTPRIPNRVYYTKRCWPACHYSPGTVKPAPHPSIHDFDRELPAGWTWINQDSAHWTLSEVPGALRIVSQAGSISDGLQNARNVLVRDAPTGHFDIITEVTFHPSSDFQSAVIFVQLSDDRVVSLSRGYCRVGGVGSGVYFDGPVPGCTGAAVPTSAETVTLMLRKAGSSYIGYYRLDEGDWVEVSRCTNLMTAPTSVGLAAINDVPRGTGDHASDAPETPADFSSFTLVERR